MNFLLIEKISPNAKTPCKIDDNSAGFQLFSAYDYCIKSNSFEFIRTDLSITLPNKNHGIIKINPELALRYSLDVISGFLDLQTHINIGIQIYNYGKEDCYIKKGDYIAMLLIEKNKADYDVFEIFQNSSIKNLNNNEIVEGHDVVDRLGCMNKDCFSCNLLNQIEKVKEENEKISL